MPFMSSGVVASALLRQGHAARRLLFLLHVISSNRRRKMRKPLTPTMHGAMDYATAVGVGAAPTLLNMPARAAGLAYGVASGILGLAAFTNFKPAIKRAVP